MTAALAALQRQLGVIASGHARVVRARTAGGITAEQVNALRSGAVRQVAPQLRAQLVEPVLPDLPRLDAKRSRRPATWTVDHLQPFDPDIREQADHDARYLTWSSLPRRAGGYLPGARASAFVAAVQPLAESLRTQGDGCSPAQRRADGLAARSLWHRATGCPTGPDCRR